jgi:hypothetical protein
MTESGEDRAEAFDELAGLAASGGPGAVAGRLVELAGAADSPRALLDALLLKARVELGLPAIPPKNLSGLPEPTRSKYEDRYIEALRAVGRGLLVRGDIAGAWPYFRVLGEKEPIAEALDAFAAAAGGDDRLGALVDIAFHQGAHPARGFELVLGHYGICSAITAFEHLPPDEAIREKSAGRLVRSLHEQLVYSLREEIKRRGEPVPAEGTPLPDLLGGRDWLFEEEAYHVDTSHLASIIRLSTLLTDPAEIVLAAELADYGRRLSDRYRYQGEPPFEDIYEDHLAYLNALAGREIDEAIARFGAKLTPPDPDGDDPMGTMPAQVLVKLLAKVGRLEQAIEVAREHLVGVPEALLICPTLPQLCLEAGRPDLLADHARRSGDLAMFAAALLERRETP